MILDEQVRKIILGVRSSDVKTDTIDESGASAVRDDKGSVFLCPKNDQVIVGRMHLGDEDGKTTYKSFYDFIVDLNPKFILSRLDL